MNQREAIEALNTLPADDVERAHHEADGILIKFLHCVGHGKVADAFEAARNDIGFWYE